MRTFTLNQIKHQLKFMIRKFFSSLVSTVKSIANVIVAIPTFIKTQFNLLVETLDNLRHNLNNLADSNMRLGIYHLKHRNWNDAIFRFKIIDKFLDPNNKIANYWLGWVYFLKQNHKKAIIHLTKAENEDLVNLLAFVKSIDNVQYVPAKIRSLHRDIMAEIFIDKFASETENILQTIIVELNNVIDNLPDNYSVLELGSNIGLLGEQISKRLQETKAVTAVECSAEMIKLQRAYFPEKKLYDKIVQVPIDEFLEQALEKYDVILSLEGFAFSAELANIFSRVFSALKSGGYFAFAIRSAPNVTFSKKLLEFAYSGSKIREELANAGFDILVAKEFTLEIKNNYYIFVCAK